MTSTFQRHETGVGQKEINFDEMSDSPGENNPGCK